MNIVCRRLLLLVLGSASSAAAHASLSALAPAGSAALEYSRFARAISGAREAVPATKQGENAPRVRADGARARASVVAVTGPGAGQSGYVHYFLLRLPDGAIEHQIGIETEEGNIAWSFPDIGVIVSPFIYDGAIEAAGKSYEVTHLYGVRPFPDEASMAALRKALPARVGKLTERAVSYCENDGPQSACMSCLGFVMRVLFPGRNDDYPEVPRDFAARVTAERYTTHDLLLYLTGLLHLPTREARLQRLNRLTVPDQMRADLQTLIRALTPSARVKRSEARDTAQNAPGASAVPGARNAPRNRL